MPGELIFGNGTVTTRPLLDRACPARVPLANAATPYNRLCDRRDSPGQGRLRPEGVARDKAVSKGRLIS
jgi:hypothetical protein